MLVKADVIKTESLISVLRKHLRPLTVRIILQCCETLTGKETESLLPIRGLNNRFAHNNNTITTTKSASFITFPTFNGPLWET